MRVVLFSEFFRLEEQDGAPFPHFAERQAGTSCDTARGYHYLHMTQRVRVKFLGGGARMDVKFI